MKKIFCFSIIFIFMMNMNAENILLEENFGTPHNTYPFDKVENKDFMPAFDKALSLENEEIRDIISNEEKPTFQNTIVALENAGSKLQNVEAVFFTLTYNETNDELMRLSSKIATILAEHSNSIMMNSELFKKVKSVYDERQNLDLDIEDNKLLEETYKSFVENGANLSAQNKEIFAKELVKLNELTDKFGQNALKATRAFEYNITDSSLLEGIPDNVKDEAKQRAQRKNKEGWTLDLSAPCYRPVLKYAKNRSLRKKMYMAYMTRATSGEFENKSVAKDIANTSLRIANIMGYKTYADYILKYRMAKNKKGVYNLLDNLSKAYKPVAKNEMSELQGFAIGFEGENIDLKPWDISYYSEMLKSKKFAINDELVRPYLKLENVIKGVFGLATKLYGITFKLNDSIPVWNKEVDAYEVYDVDGKFLSVLYTDFHPRKGKHEGAWMNDFNPQHNSHGENFRPHISITMNFVRSTKDKPSLLNLEELTTFLHEFGHSIHGMLSNVKYASLSGTNVYRDFVEMPSQMMENFAYKKEFLDMFAEHYKTGEKIPESLIEKIKAVNNYHAGLNCVGQLAYGYLDMAWYTLEKPFDGDIYCFEHGTMNKALVMANPDSCLMSPVFTHIFSGGYSSGYYGYKWAEVLDADVFDYLTENKVFDRDRATSFRKNILSKGGIEDPSVLYEKFRGQAPSIEALLKRDGIK